MKKLSFLTSILLAVMMVLAFAGCGGSNESEEGEDAAEYSNSVVTVGSTLSFEAKDLNGKAVSSKDLFAENTVTMLNVWGTFCGPCIGEMPELEKISQEDADRGAAIIGLVCDVTEEDDSCLQDAFDLIKDTGVTYTNLYWNDSMESQMAVEAIPTTVFVDKEGTVLGEAIVGADPDAYRAALDKFLGESE